MEVKSEVKPKVKPEVKPEVKQKKPKIRRKPLILSDQSSDEELADTSKDLYSKRQEEFKSRLAESRLQTLESCRTDDNELADDVFTDKISDSEPKNKTKEEINEIKALLHDLNPNSDINDIKDDNNVMNDSLIVVESDECLPSCDQNVANNTRSKKGKTVKKKATPIRNGKKKIIRRKSGRKSKESEFDEQKAFDRLDGMQAMDDIEVVEDFNTSLNVSQDIEEYIKERDNEIKVKYKAVIEKFTIKSTEKFSKIMPIIAQKFNENVSELIFELNEKIMDSDSTPQTVGLTISDIIVCHKRVANKSVNNNECKDPNVLSLKLRDKTMKSAETLNVNKFDKIQVMIDWFSKYKKLAPKKFRLKFDGETLDPNSTIAESDIEDDSQIDVILL